MLIVISDDMEEDVVKALEEIGEVRYRPEDLGKSLKDADVLIVRSATKVTRELISGASKLKMVLRAGVGLDNIDKEACREKGAVIRNTPRASANAVAELALALMLAGLRNVQKAHHQMKNKRWEKKALTGTEVAGKTLGIIGYGRIGSIVGRKAHALGMRIIAYNPPPRHEDDIVEYIEELDAFLEEADVISLHVPVTEETRGMINKENITKMKDGAFLINTARGEVVDEDALYEACKSGKLKGAALDVYREEPYAGKLLELDNVYFTPHLGAATREAQLRIGGEVVRILKEEFGTK